MKIYKVGGCVRDELLGMDPQDIDYVVVGATPQIMLEHEYKQVGKDFPVFLHPITGEEYALARKEVSTGDGYQDFKFYFGPDVTLKEDLSRRDFTINAIAKDLNTSELIDPFNGIYDLKTGLLRHINNSFKTDPLRILRGCRFSAQLRFHLHADTIMLCRKMVRLGMLKSLSAERIWKEIEKALHTVEMPLFLESLGLTNALYEVLPEIHALLNIPENEVYHPEGNTYEHLILALKQVKRMFLKEGETLEDLPKEKLEEIALVNFGLLCHDLGKALTPKEEWPAHHRHDELGLEVIDKLCNRLKVPNEYRDFAKLCCKNHMKFYELLKSHKKKHYDFVKEISNNFKDFRQLKLICIVHECDLLGRAGIVSEFRVTNCLNTLNYIKKVYDIMEGVTLKDLPKETQENLSKYNGEKFGKLYRDAMISYLKSSLKSF